jgi:raffinose/stachyose/melibiose transport system permease protein
VNAVLGDKKAILLLLGPALLTYTVVMFIPVFSSFGFTFFSGNAVRGFEFVGIENYLELLDDANVWKSLGFTLQYAVVVTIAQVVMGYLLALLYTFYLKHASSLIRTLVFFPVVLPTVAVAALFSAIFAIAPQDGLVNTAIEALGLTHIDFFATGASSFLVLVLMDVWRSMGFYAVLLYTGLVDIPEDIIESARIDGATGVRLFRHIVLPLSLPVLLSSVIFSINGTLKVFDSVIALTNGGPGTETSPLTVYMYRQAFSYGEYGYGATVATLLTIVCLLVTVFIFRSTRRDLTK